MGFLSLWVTCSKIYLSIKMTQTNTEGGAFKELGTSLMHPKVEIFFS